MAKSSIVGSGLDGSSFELSAVVGPSLAVTSVQVDSQPKSSRKERDPIDAATSRVLELVRYPLTEERVFRESGKQFIEAVRLLGAEATPATITTLVQYLAREFEGGNRPYAKLGNAERFAIDAVAQAGAVAEPAILKELEKGKNFWRLEPLCVAMIKAGSPLIESLAHAIPINRLTSHSSYMRVLARAMETAVNDGFVPTEKEIKIIGDMLGHSQKEHNRSRHEGWDEVLDPCVSVLSRMMHTSDQAQKILATWVAATTEYGSRERVGVIEKLVCIDDPKIQALIRGIAMNEHDMCRSDAHRVLASRAALDQSLSERAVTIAV